VKVSPFTFVGGVLWHFEPVQPGGVEWQDEPVHGGVDEQLWLAAVGVHGVQLEPVHGWQLAPVQGVQLAPVHGVQLAPVHGGGVVVRQPVCAGLVRPMPWLRSHS
jgi:hypothetical protein